MPLTLPFDGQTNWGDELNVAVNQAETDAQTAITSINNHAANIPADPHGDRAYASSLVNPITNGVNQPNGFVQLNAQGQVPTNLIAQVGGSGGTFTGVFDVVARYNAPRNNGVDASSAIQQALNDCNAAGGGEVWVPAGTYSLATYPVIGSNTWLHLSEGAHMVRIIGSTTPPYLLTNIVFGSGGTPGTNIMVSGGTWDAVAASLTANCTPMFFIQAVKLSIRDTVINNVFNQPCIEINGCTNVQADHLFFTGTGSTAQGPVPTVPAIRINASTTQTSPVGLPSSVYNNTVCKGVNLNACGTGATTFTNPPVAAVAGSDLNQSPFNNGPIMATSLYSLSHLPLNVQSGNWTGYASAANSFA